MRFTIRRSNCVAVGRFNPAILTPTWVIKHDILPNSEAEMKSAMGSAVTDWSMCGLTWRASLARFEVEASREGADPGEFVAKILEKLEHTPLRAVGSNFSLEVTYPEDRRSLFDVCKSPLLSRLASEQYSPLDGTAVATYAYEDAVVSVSLAFEREEVGSIDFNFNRQSLTATDAASAGRRWSHDKEQALGLATKLIGD